MRASRGCRARRPPRCASRARPRWRSCRRPARPRGAGGSCCRRSRICSRRRTSTSRPMTGSNPLAPRARDQVVREAREHVGRRGRGAARPRAARCCSAAMCGRKLPGPSANACSTTAAGPRISCESALSRCSTSTVPAPASFSARARSCEHRVRQVREARRWTCGCARAATRPRPTRRPGRRPPCGRPLARRGRARCARASR